MSGAALIVLVVDDEPEVRLLARVVLETSGVPVRVVEAGTGAAAILLAAAERPDLVVVDRMMPGIDGLETARRLLDADPTLVVALCSAAMDGRIEAAAFAIGVRHCLGKHQLLDLPELLEGLPVYA